MRTLPVFSIALQRAQELAPLDVEVPNSQLIVQALQLGVEKLILAALPAGARFVAEEHAAAEGTDSVDGAEIAGLERTAPSVGGADSAGGQCVQKRGGFQRRYHQTVT